MIGTLAAARAGAERESQAAWAALAVALEAQLTGPEQAPAAPIIAPPPTSPPLAAPPTVELKLDSPEQAEDEKPAKGEKPAKKKRSSPTPPARPASLPADDKVLAAGWPHEATREELHWISLGLEQDKEGNWRRRNQREVDLDMRYTTMRHLRARGEFFRVGFGFFYLDKQDKLLIPVSKDSPGLLHLLFLLGYMPMRGYTPSIVASVINVAARSKMRDYHRIAFFGKDAIYLRSNENEMWRIKSNSVEEVPIGTDDVVLIASDMAPLPSLPDTVKLAEEMRGAVGRACTQVLPALPLSHHLTTRWATDSPLSPERALQLFITRVLFLFAASRYSLWPIVSLIGDQGSGKSTLLELLLCLLRDDPRALVKAYPAKDDGLVVTLANSSVVCFDNVDTLKTVPDTICHLSTGAEVPQRKLFTDSEVVTLKIQNHGFFTARVDPFASRPDVNRRTIPLTMQPADLESTVSKDKLKGAILSARPMIWAEILLRCENMVQAHLQYGENQYPSLTEMTDFEVFSYRCAEFEGTLEETREIWKCYRVLYLEAITENNFLVLAIRNWLGRKGNAGREVSSQVLFGELQVIYDGTGSFPYRNPAVFGKYLNRDLPALRVLGLKKPPRTNKGQIYIFTPSEDEMKRCYQEYRDFEHAAISRAVLSLQRSGSMLDHDPENRDDIDGCGNPMAKQYRN